MVIGKYKHELTIMNLNQAAKWFSDINSMITQETMNYCMLEIHVYHNTMLRVIDQYFGNE